MIVLPTAHAATANWVVLPERAVAWAVAMFAIPLMWGASSLLLLRSRRQSKNEAAYEHARISMRAAFTVAGLLLLGSLCVKLLVTLEVIANPDISRRATMVFIGLVLAFPGNSLPKMLMPLSQLQCDGSRLQAFQRFSGWLWVLTGLAFAIAWMALSIDLARSVSVLTALASTTLNVVWMLRLKRV